MTAASFTDIVTLGTVTGMRSLAGAAALASKRDDVLGRVVPLMAAGEMIADKLPGIGDRIGAFPLAGRIIMGALVGGAFARERRVNMIAGAAVGAAASISAAYVAFHLRRRFPGPPALGGLLEDMVAVGLASRYGRRPSAV